MRIFSISFINLFLIVLTLDESNFVQLTRKPKDELWAVDFYAPWCGPCQKLGPEWRKFAKEVKKETFLLILSLHFHIFFLLILTFCFQMVRFPEVKVAEVDCVANTELCNAQNIRSYPTIRLYPLDSRGLSSVA